MTPKEIADNISAWMKAYALGARMDGYVVGVSGGIDSALVSTLAAATGLRTLCVALPIHQAAAHVARAAEHIRWLTERYPRVESLEIDLTAPYDRFASAMPTGADTGRQQLAGANTRSRLRMTALYHLAGLNNLLVAGTGNKIEDFGIGFFTKYGDGGVDLSPIGSLTKTQVYALSEALGIVASIRAAAPSDGLFGDDRSDEAQIGATYPELEWAMERAVAGARPEEFSGREREVFEIYTRRHRTNRHKMELPPVWDFPE